MTLFRRAASPAAWAARIVALATSVGTATLAVANRSAIHSLDDAQPIHILLPVSFGLIGVIRPSGNQNGAGLTNMGDRLDALGGTVEVTSRPGQGTTVSGTLPARALVPVA